MGKQQHTPGPWGINKQGIVQHVTADGMFVGVAEPGIEADAHLIAAAPDLLAACELALEQTDKEARAADWEALRAAIAKAKGEAA